MAEETATRVVGIDLGTTNSLVAFMQGETPTIIPGEDGDRLVPSVVAFDEARGAAVDAPVRQLPLETLFCGRAGLAWETRGTLDLRALAARAAVAGVVRAACADAGESLRCAATP